jgi:hypothetical protein
METLSQLDMPKGFDLGDLYLILDQNLDHKLTKEEFINGMFRLTYSNDFQRLCIVQLAIAQTKEMIAQVCGEMRGSFSSIARDIAALHCHLGVKPLPSIGSNEGGPAEAGKESLFAPVSPGGGGWEPLKIKKRTISFHKPTEDEQYAACQTTKKKESERRDEESSQLTSDWQVLAQASGPGLVARYHELNNGVNSSCPPTWEGKDNEVPAEALNLGMKPDFREMPRAAADQDKSARLAVNDTSPVKIHIDNKKVCDLKIHQESQSVTETGPLTPIETEATV